MDTKKRLLTLAAALFISLTACEGSLPMGPTSGLETGEVTLSLAAMTHTEVTIDFEDIQPGSGGSTVLSTYSNKEGLEGFTLSNPTMPVNGFLSPEDGRFPAYVGSRTLINIAFNGVTLLTKVGGGAFDVLSIDIAEVPFSPVRLGDPVSAVTVTFTGTKADGSLVSEDFTTNGIFELETLTFMQDFTNLESLSWVQTEGFFHQFDNIVLSFDDSGPSDPTTRDQCKKGGFAQFGFRNQGQCVRFVEKNENAKNKR